MDLGAPEIILLVLVIVLLFGAKKLPDLARGSGRALRIFKAETKGLTEDDDAKVASDTPVTRSALPDQPSQPPVVPTPPAAPSQTHPVDQHAPHDKTV